MTHADLLEYLVFHDLHHGQDLNGVGFRISDLGFGFASAGTSLMLSVSGPNESGAVAIQFWSHVTPAEAMMIIELFRSERT